MVADGRLPKPDFYLGRLPIWTDETLDAADALRARKPVAEASATTTA